MSLGQDLNPGPACCETKVPKLSAAFCLPFGTGNILFDFQTDRFSTLTECDF
jgi:hypothetical protein